MEIENFVDRAIAGDKEAENNIDKLLANMYGLSLEETKIIINE